MLRAQQEEWEKRRDDERKELELARASLRDARMSLRKDAARQKSEFEDRMKVLERRGAEFAQTRNNIELREMTLKEKQNSSKRLEAEARAALEESQRVAKEVRDARQKLQDEKSALATRENAEISKMKSEHERMMASMKDECRRKISSMTGSMKFAEDEHQKQMTMLQSKLSKAHDEISVAQADLRESRALTEKANLRATEIHSQIEIAESRALDAKRVAEAYKQQMKVLKLVV